ncbi:unnamed protein product [Diabrotica balteata]|uniref:Uncharacterized protein n=1 Tax=Diabrotica balteata TaxID=107213 RepID=A0A9N9X824_DIABA|nr:unnamed protein product [Diabrotica balteata]
MDGTILRDKRGCHSKSNKLSSETISLMKHQIETIQKKSGRKEHYNLHESKRIYLFDELNVNKLWDHYIEKNPDNKVSYEAYRKHFNENFNISFGYPRMDTCSSCYQFLAEIKCINSQLRTCTDETVKEELNQILKNW